MSSPLPHVDRLASLPATLWTDLRSRLDAASFASEYTHNVRRAAIGAYADVLQRPLVLWHVRRSHEAAARAIRLFVLGDPLSIDDAAALLSGPVLDALLDAALLIEFEPGRVVSAFDLRVFRGLLILCDDLAHKGDAVYGAGYGTAAFCDLSHCGGRTRTALDIGCGAGAVALWLSSRVGRVIASDVNPRALAFVRINAALNGVTNVEVRSGSLFESIDGDVFDLITSQPPYVPQAPGLRPATYLFGGPRGNELVMRLFSELPRHLSRGGRGMVVFEHPIRNGGTADQDLFAADTATRALFIVGDEVDADSYSLRHAAPELRRGIDAFDAAATHMREHLDALAIRSLCPAVAVFERTDEGGGWTAMLRAGNNLWNEVSTDLVERLLASQAVLRAPADPGRLVRFRVPEGSLFVRRLTSTADANDTVYLGLPPGYLLSSLELSRAEWRLLTAGAEHASAEPLPHDLIAKAARVGLIEQ
jgi:SAM-dependent methyltransferase